MPIPKSTTAIAYPLLLATVLLAAIPLRSEGQPAPTNSAPAPSPGVDCFPYLLNMSDCLSFVESGSNLSQPEKACCPELVQLLDTQPMCLCQLLSRPAQVGIPLDMAKALKLPSACNVSTPPVSFCAAVGVPAADVSPGGALSPNGLPSDGSGSGSAAAVTTDNGTPTSLPSYIIVFIPLVFTSFFF